MTSSLAVTLSHVHTQVARSRELRLAFPALYAQARRLIARSRELCLVYRRIRGGSDLEFPLIAEIIARTPMCAECVAAETGIAGGSVTDGLNRLRQFMALIIETARCQGCSRMVTVYRLGDASVSAHAPTAPPRARPMLVTQAEAIWRFLESRRGEMFCTACIAGVLFATKRIDRAILAAEGRGARRQYGPCAICGRERLLCGLTG